MTQPSAAAAAAAAAQQAVERLHQCLETIRSADYPLQFDPFDTQATESSSSPPSPEAAGVRQAVTLVLQTLSSQQPALLQPPLLRHSAESLRTALGRTQPHRLRVLAHACKCLHVVSLKSWTVSDFTKALVLLQEPLLQTRRRLSPRCRQRFFDTCELLVLRWDVVFIAEASCAGCWPRQQFFGVSLGDLSRITGHAMPQFPLHCLHRLRDLLHVTQLFQLGGSESAVAAVQRRLSATGAANLDDFLLDDDVTNARTVATLLKLFLGALRPMAPVETLQYQLHLPHCATQYHIVTQLMVFVAGYSRRQQQLAEAGGHKDPISVRDAVALALAAELGPHAIN